MGKIRKGKIYSASQFNGIPKRSEVSEKYKWNLTDIYKSDELWENDFKWVENRLDEYDKYAGKIGTSAATLLECLKFDDELSIKLEHLRLYSLLMIDSDMKVGKYQSMESRIKNLTSRVNEKNSFIRPEIISIPPQLLEEMFSLNKELSVYKHMINNLIRMKLHTLSSTEEKIIASTAELVNMPHTIFSMLMNADVKFGKTEDETGAEVELSHARYNAAMYSKDRAYRERAFKNYFKPLIELRNTFGAIFNANLRSHIYDAKVRKYNSTLSASLDKDNIPKDVYLNLINTVNNNLSPLHRWAKIKKKVLGLDYLHPYDIYVDITKDDQQIDLSYESAKKILYTAFNPLGREYLEKIKTAFENRWIDVYESKSKRSGAYSSDTAYNIHPYILLNWSNIVDDIFTLSHELGHAMHSYYSGKYQPYPYSDYSIFLAEVASTFNEMMVFDHFIQNSKSIQSRLYFIQKYLNAISSTLYRQTMFAEFELEVYRKTESGKALTPEDYCKIFGELFHRYWGNEVIVDEEESYTWLRIPHFYYRFYVFQYATGFAAAGALNMRIKSEGESAVQKYLHFLKSGSSEYSLDILKKAGVDMTSPEPILAAIQRMNELLDQMESLLNDTSI